MKKTYKLFSLFLALTMLCTVFAMPVSATTYSTDDNNGKDSHHYTDAVKCEGTVDTFGEYIRYEVSCYNESGPRDIYDLYAQCVAFYSDDSYDISYVTNNPNIGWGRTERYHGTLDFDSAKTAISFDAEFVVSFQGELFWEGYIYTTSTLGINA